MTAHIPKLVLSALCLLVLPVAAPTANPTFEAAIASNADDYSGSTCEAPSADGVNTDGERALGGAQPAPAVKCKDVCCERVCHDECCDKECNNFCKKCRSECRCC